MTLEQSHSKSGSESFNRSHGSSFFGLLRKYCEFEQSFGCLFRTELISEIIVDEENYFRSASVLYVPISPTFDCVEGWIVGSEEEERYSYEKNHPALLHSKHHLTECNDLYLHNSLLNLQNLLFYFKYVGLSLDGVLYFMCSRSALHDFQ